jgi:hypothetical protein
LRSRAARANGAGPHGVQATPLDGRDRSASRSTKLSGMVGVGRDTGD